MVTARSPSSSSTRPSSGSWASKFREKHQKAVNLELYKQQLRGHRALVRRLCAQLPGKTEVPNLLTDISQTGLAAGLEQKLFQPAPELRKDFYAEQPIKIRLTGSYHQFGGFVSGIASLPRIVTLHDIDIKSDPKDPYDVLTLDVTAKTYRYLDEEELARRRCRAAQDRGGATPRHVRRLSTQVNPRMTSRSDRRNRGSARRARSPLQTAMWLSAIALGAALSGCSGRDAELDQFIAQTSRNRAVACSPCRTCVPTKASSTKRKSCVRRSFPVAPALARARCARTTSAIASSWSSSRSTL